ALGRYLVRRTEYPLWAATRTWHFCLANVRFGPIADSCAATKSAALFYYLFGSHQEGRRNREAKCFHGPKVDRRFKGHRCLYRKIGRPSALQNAINIGRCSTKRVGDFDAVRHQTAGRYEKAERIDRGQPVMCSESDDGVAMRVVKNVRQNK